MMMPELKARTTRMDRMETATAARLMKTQMRSVGPSTKLSDLDWMQMIPLCRAYSDRDCHPKEGM
jgi:hypothetical protein